MRVQVVIGFDQLIQLAKQLPASQWTKLKTEVEKEQKQSGNNEELEAFLLTAPPLLKSSWTKLPKARKAISQWRTK
jgi:hypothetical protein